jgi:hypothetical protein
VFSLWLANDPECSPLAASFSVKFIEITISIMFSYIEKRLRDAHARLKKRGVPLAANQVNYSLIYRTPELNGVKAACDELGITLIAYSPIAQGRNQSLNFLYPIIR